MDERDRDDRRDTTYMHGYDPVVERFMAARTADEHAAFFLPSLRPGMRLLDCGCGPGTTTVGLAAVVAPGQVVGIDIEPSQVAAARAHAAERGVTNIRFEVGDIMALPFPDASFDAAFSHAATQHLRDPPGGLSEMHRVLAAGGVIGLRDDDWGSFVIAPTTTLLDQAVALFLRAWEHHGGHPYWGRRHRGVLQEVGFIDCRVSASNDSFATPERTRAWAAAAEAQFRSPSLWDLAIAQDWVDAGTLEAMIGELRAWGERDDAFNTLTYCEAWGRKAS